MDNKKAISWLYKHEIELDESFTQTLKKLAIIYKKQNHLKRLDDVYKLIGTHKEYISYWENHPYSTQTKNFKHNVIHNAGKIFCLTAKEEEILANKAGLSFQIDDNFNTILKELINNSYKTIYSNSQVSERMFRHAMTDKIPSKETLLAITITLGISLEDIEMLLPKAGYFLSPSLAFDMVIKYLIKNANSSKNPYNLLSSINDILYELDLPLLMTRQNANFLKSDN